jgi:hypothetical protein
MGSIVGRFDMLAAESQRSVESIYPGKVGPVQKGHSEWEGADHVKDACVPQSSSFYPQKNCYYAKKRPNLQSISFKFNLLTWPDPELLYLMFLPSGLDAGRHTKFISG